MLLLGFVVAVAGTIIWLYLSEPDAPPPESAAPVKEDQPAAPPPEARARRCAVWQQTRARDGRDEAIREQ